MTKSLCLYRIMLSNDVVTTQPQVIPPQEDATPEQRPRGIQVLDSCIELEINQIKEAIEIACCCCDRADRFEVYTPGYDGHVLRIQEVSQCYARSCLGGARNFSAKIHDIDDVYIGSVYRPITCSRGCTGCCCCMPEMWIYSPPPFKCASIRERRSCLSPKYDILSTTEEVLFTMATECCYVQTCGWFMNTMVNIYDSHGAIVAEVVKPSYKNAEELLGFQNKYTIKFVCDLAAREKLIILGAWMLLHLHNFADNRRYCA